MKKSMVITILVLFSIMISISYVSAGLFDFLQQPRYADQEYTVSVGNAAPTISITSVDGDNVVDLNPAASTPVVIIFEVTDGNGYDDINNNALTIDYNFGGELRTGSFVNCGIPVDAGNTRTFTCTINMEHYDSYATWAADVDIDDFGGLSATPATLNFDVNQLKYISLTPPTVTFGGSVSPGTDDVIGDDTVVVNGGNYNIPNAPGGLSITAYALYEAGGNSIPAISFKVRDQSTIPDDCTGGVDMSQASPIDIPDFVHPKGTSVTPLPTRNVQYCLDVPAGINEGNYATNIGLSHVWEFTI